MADRSESSGLKPQEYRGEHPPEHYQGIHEWARTHDPEWIYYFLRFCVKMTRVLYRTRVVGAENIPKEGMVLLVPNHFSFGDHFFVGAYVPRAVRFMGKSQLFGGPIRWICKHGGAFPVARGYADELAMETARVILVDQNGVVLLYIQGGRSRGLKVDGEARPGVGRLALTTGTPVVPIAIYGTQYLRRWRRLWLFPKIIVEYGEPMRWDKQPNSTKDDWQRVSNAVFEQIKQMYGPIDAAQPVRWYHRFR